jgi:hypothetical protein
MHQAKHHLFLISKLCDRRCEILDGSPEHHSSGTLAVQLWGLCLCVHMPTLTDDWQSLANVSRKEWVDNMIAKTHRLSAT